jgi:hypothetical protein
MNKQIKNSATRPQRVAILTILLIRKMAHLSPALALERYLWSSLSLCNKSLSSYVDFSDGSLSLSNKSLTWLCFGKVAMSFVKRLLGL